MGKNPEGKLDAWLLGEEDGLRLDSERMCGSFGGGGLRRRLGTEPMLEEESMWGSLELLMVAEEGENGGGGGGDGDGKTRGGGG